MFTDPITKDYTTIILKIKYCALILFVKSFVRLPPECPSYAGFCAESRHRHPALFSSIRSSSHRTHASNPSPVFALTKKTFDAGFRA